MASLTQAEQAMIDKDVEALVEAAKNPDAPMPYTQPTLEPERPVEYKSTHIKMPISGSNIDYRFNEDKYIAEFSDYVNNTYGEHYSGKYQATDMIIDAGHGEGFCIGSIMKYAKRYGKKEGRNRKDLMKILHYALFMLHVHDREKEMENNGD